MKDLNNRQKRWLDSLADFDIDISCYLGKVNVVVDALNKRLVICGAKLSAMIISYEDQREDVANSHLEANW